MKRALIPLLFGGKKKTPWYLAGGVAAADCVAAYKAKGAASYAASKVNLVSPGTYDLVDTGHIPSWSSLNGWLFYGSNYFDTGIVPKTGWSMVVGFNFAENTNTNWACGVDSAGDARFYLGPAWNTGRRLYGSGGYAPSLGYYQGGVMAIAGQQPYYNGSPDGGALGAWNTTQSNPVFIGCLNRVDGTPSFYYRGTIQFFAIYKTVLSATQVQAITNSGAASSCNCAIAKTPTGTQRIIVQVPKTYNAAVGAPLIIYHHGVGESYNAPVVDLLKEGVLEALLNAGYIVASSEAYLNNWGNSNSLTAYNELYTYCTTNYNITRVCAWSQSMGGLSSLLHVAAGAIPYKGWLGTYPACNLRKAYDNASFTAAIKAAYGIAADGSDYDAKTSGHDPVLLSGAAFSGIRMRFYASAGDSIIPKADNSDAMATLVTGYATEADVVACTGNHGDTSHFQPSDYLSFFNRCV